MKISVIGAGFSGLTLAYYLNKKGLSVEVYEAQERPGGLISTIKTKDGLIETAATSILETPHLTEILGDIGLKPLRANKESKKRFILRNHRPRQFPLGLLDTFHLIKGVIRLLLFKKKWSPLPGETLSKWGDRTFSPNIRKFLISPALQGIYADRSENLSASLVLKRLFSSEKLKSKGPVNFEFGMGQFIFALEKYLSEKGVIFHYNSKLSKETLPKTPYVFATSLKDARPFLKDIPDLPSKNMTSATLFFDSPTPLEGFGVLFPKEEELHSYGVLFNNCMFAERGEFESETWILSDVTDNSEEEILEKINSDRSKFLNSNQRVINFKISHWPEAFPLYGKELEGFLKQKIDLPKNVWITGNYLGNLGLSGILNQNSSLSNDIVKEMQ